jgi:hypothetical protein
MSISDRKEGDAIRSAIDWIREHVELRGLSESPAEG